jgi:hypothetical protein
VQCLLYGRWQRQPQVGLAPPHHERRPFGRGMRPQSHQVLSGIHWLPIHETHPITSILTIAVIPICACSPVGEVWILSMYCAWVRFPWDHHRASRTTLAPAGTASECRPTAHRTRAATETTPTRPPWDTFRYAPCRHDVLKYQIKRTSYLWLHSLGPCSRNTGRQGCKLDTNPIGMIEDQLSRKAHPSLPEFLAELWILQPFMKRSAAVLFMQCLIV